MNAVGWSLHGVLLGECLSCCSVPLLYVHVDEACIYIFM